MNIDLTNYVIAGASAGDWMKNADAFRAGELRLGTGDIVTLAGPLRVYVTIQARNFFNVLGASDVAMQTRDVYSYPLDIPPGRTWTYPSPQALASFTPAVGRDTPPLDAAGAVLTGVNPAATDAARRLVTASAFSRELLWGANAGFAIVIRPTGPDQCADPCAPDPCRPIDPCAPRKKDCECGGRCGGGCGCGCHQEHGADDLPCDFATGRGSSLGAFFPAACEPCAPGAFVGMPPVKGPSLVVPSARGGTLRTRYFNGMFITKEDLWADQNNNRIKHALMNRAMGQGVVWGLDLCLDGATVCVLPGYGVDCCGNDIVISSAYRVDGQALVRDPAAAAIVGKRGPQRMNLLLEYYECPEQPRPVHGDPCSTDSMSCEMSRIRETARLRLVPPCEVDDSGPIRDFLDEIRRLKGDPLVGPILGGAAAVPAPGPGLLPQVPFTVTVEGLDQGGVVGALTLAPRLTTDAPSTVMGDAVGTPNRSMMNRVRVTITANPGFTLVAGNVVRQTPPGAIVPAPVNTATTVSWEDVIPEPFESKLVYRFGGWKYQAAGGSLTSPGTDLLIVKLPAPGLRMRAHVEVGPSLVEASQIQQPPRFPCSAEACDPEGKPRFPVPLPWLHADPSHPDQAADPKVIMLAILYALVVSKTSTLNANSTPAVQAEMEKLGAALNATAWQLFYDEVPEARRADLMEALRRLLQAWCKLLLYPGPRCECGCEPHGVIIGCAVVEGGTLRSVDPWGGRRWVVHYPLLAYWGKQFGLQPFDAIASKFFDLLCCVAHLQPSQDGNVILRDAAILRAAVPAVPTPVVSLGASALVMDHPANIASRLAELGVAADRTIVVSQAEFVWRVVQALNNPAATAVPGAGVVLYKVQGLPEMHFVAPETAAATTRASSQPPPSSPVASGGLDRLTRTVRTALSARSANTAIPPLLRDASEMLVKDLLVHQSPEPASDAGRAARGALADLGITNVAALLVESPDSLLVDVLNGANAAGLADLLEVSEKAAAKTAKTVGDALVKLAGDRLVSREDLRDPALADTFTSTVGDALKGAVSREAIATAVARAAGRVQ
ncbi:MAG: hypothetical protein ABI665_21180 [Vicinamibacterales bacterium]